MKPQTVMTIGKYTFALIGFALLFGAYTSFQSSQRFIAQALVAEGTVIELISSRSSDSITYRPRVTFSAQDGQRYEFVSSSGSNPPSYSRGERVTVLYSADNPNNAQLNGFFSLWGLTLILGVMGAVFFAIGGGMVALKWRGEQRRAHLQQHGQRILADFVSVEHNTQLKVNGRSPFRILCQWHNPSSREVHLFKSDNLWFDPSKLITQEQMTVMIDKQNPKHYWVDVSFLPKVHQH